VSIGNIHLINIRKERKIMTTFMQKSGEITRNWYVIDANDQVLGRVAAKAAAVLRGKHKPTFTPHVDCGDYIIIINAENIHLTGDKLNKKMYYNHSGYPGGLRERTAKEMKKNYPVEMIERAINGMLPNGRLGRAMSKKLFVYAGSNHPHMAQEPEVLEIK
jgi:large subunit ribosomal protein L13